MYCNYLHNMMKIKVFVVMNRINSKHFYLYIYLILNLKNWPYHTHIVLSYQHYEIEPASYFNQCPSNN